MKVAHCKKEPYDVLIDRTTKWGNPFIVGIDGDRNEVCDKYEKWLPTQPHLMNALHELTDKILGCWCKPKRCHGDFLLKLANEPLIYINLSGD